MTPDADTDADPRLSGTSFSSLVESPDPFWELDCRRALLRCISIARDRLVLVLSATTRDPGGTP